jgi:hypothetical protein
MAFPNDLNDVVVFKIHPAIGIARVSKSDDYFIYGAPPSSYKSNGLMKRQAVKFRLFAYGENHVGLGELTPKVMQKLGITPVWSAKVANRKIAFLERVPLSGNQHVLSAEASSNDANDGQLSSSLADFAEGDTIPLGQITGDGTFIPPKAGVFRKRPGIRVPNYPNFTAEIADTSCDGSISCALNGIRNSPPVLPACIIVAPGDYSPDVDPEPIRRYSLLIRLQQDIAVATDNGPGTIHNQVARELDEAALRPCTGDFAPGFEVSFGGGGEVPDLRALFYRSGRDEFIDPREIRVRYRQAAGDPGAVRGQLTSGLCSPWQTDFTACVGYWASTLPESAFLDEDDLVEVNVYRKEYGDTGPFPETLTNGDDFERHQDKVGIVRRRNARQIETERRPGDNIVG